jgi:hypothetical protein
VNLKPSPNKKIEVKAFKLQQKGKKINNKNKLSKNKKNNKNELKKVLLLFLI